MTEIPNHLLTSYFSNLFHICDKGDTGCIEPTELHELLRLSGFCFRACQLRDIAGAASEFVTEQGTIGYLRFIPLLIQIVKLPSIAGKEAGVWDTREAKEDDWDIFATALSNLHIS